MAFVDLSPTPPPGALVMINGLYYKIGRNESAYWWDGHAWLRSMRSVENILKLAKQQEAERCPQT